MFTSKFTKDSFLRVQKNPGNLRIPGYLTLGHNGILLIPIYILLSVNQ